MLFESVIYNKIIIPLTKLCYSEVLSRLEDNSKLLDVGIGTGKALCENQNLIIQKKLKIVGIDINHNYLETCQQLIEKHQLQNYISIKEISFYNIPTSELFDAIYFSSSFMLLPNQLEALEHAKKLLKPNGKIYFTQVLHKKPTPFIEFLKPKLFYLTSINFGKITYEKNFLELLEHAGFNQLTYFTIKKWYNCSEQLIIIQSK